MDLFSQTKGSTSLLLLFATVFVVVFLTATSLLPFKDQILTSIYPKSASHATSSASLTDTPNSTIFEEIWQDFPSIEKSWNLKTQNCQDQIVEKTLSCQNFEAKTKQSFDGVKNLIISGSFKTDPDSEFNLSLVSGDQIMGKLSIAPQNAFLETQNNNNNSTTRYNLENISTENTNNFKIIYAQLSEGKTFVYYYLNNASTPIFKKELTPQPKLFVQVVCRGKCTLDPLKIIGSPI